MQVEVEATKATNRIRHFWQNNVLEGQENFESWSEHD